MSGFQATRPLDPWRWLGVPTLGCMAALIIFDIPVRIAGLSLPEPAFGLVPAFAWAVIRPSIVPPFLLLGLGLFVDIYTDGPLGLWGLSYLAAYTAIFLTRSMMAGQSRVMMWIWYGGACFCAFVAPFLTTMLDALNTPSLLSVFWQFLATALLYPFAHRLIERFEDADVRFR